MELNNTDLMRVKRDARRKKRQRQAFWDFLTLLVGLMTMAIVGLGVYLFLRPESALNPFPPPTMPVVVIIPSAIPTTEPIPKIVTEESSGLNPDTATKTPIASQTPEPTTTYSPTVLMNTLPGPSSTPAINVYDIFATLTATAHSDYPYGLKAMPSAIQAFHLPPEKVCNWSGVGGQAIDIQNRPATGILVQLGGYLSRIYFNQTSLTGTALQYGPAGYEFTLGEELRASKNGLWVQLVEQSRNPLSEKVYFDTFTDCNKNLILINFKQLK